MAQYSISLADVMALRDTMLLESDVVDLLVKTLISVGISTIYIADVKSVDVQRVSELGVLEMQEVKPVIVGVHTYNDYSFTLHYYNLSPTAYLLKENDIKADIMFKLMYAPITYGGVVVGFTIAADYTPTIYIRGAWKIGYKIHIWVAY